MVIEVSPAQPKNAPSPILVTLLGILTEIKLVLSLKAFDAILVTVYFVLQFI